MSERARQTEYVRRWRVRNRDRWNQYMRKYNSGRQADPIYQAKRILASNRQRQVTRCGDRRYKMHLSLEQIAALIVQPCVYCGLDPNGVYCLGVDRIVNSEPYTVANSAPCCSICNAAKGVLDVEVFIDRCIAIAQNHTRGYSLPANRHPRCQEPRCDPAYT